MNGTERNEIEVQSYTILAYNLPAFEKLLRRLNRKAAKLGVLPITLTTGACSLVTEEDGITVTEYLAITVAGAAPRVNGWEFVATLEHSQDDDGQPMNVIRTVPTFEGTVPDKYRTASQWCDHCKTSRRRVDTFLVHKDPSVKLVEERDEFLQVGRNCLGDFLGGKNPHRYAAIAEMWSLVNEAGHRSWEPGEREPVAVEKAEALAFVAESVIRDGWTSRGKARELDYVEATADKALHQMLPPKGTKRDWEPSPAAVALSERVLEWADEWIPAQLAREQSSNYVWNLKVSLSGDRIALRQFGIAASVIGAYVREQERDLQYKAKNASKVGSTHQGNVGGKVLNVPMTVESLRPMPDRGYGPSTLIQFMDENGNVWKWFASKVLRFSPNDKVIVSGSIKGHDEYNGIKSTVLTRAKVEARRA